MAITKRAAAPDSRSRARSRCVFFADGRSRTQHFFRKIAPRLTQGHLRLHCEHRPSEQVSLYLPATQFEQRFELRLGLDTLCNDVYPQCRTERNYPVYAARRAAVQGRTVDEGFVQF